MLLKNKKGDVNMKKNKNSFLVIKLLFLIFFNFFTKQALKFDF